MNKKKITVIITLCFTVLLAGCKAKETASGPEPSSEQIETETAAALAEAESPKNPAQEEEETQPVSPAAASDAQDTQSQPQPAAKAAPGTQAAPKSSGGTGGQDNSTGNSPSGNKEQNETAGREESTTRQQTTWPQQSTKPQQNTNPPQNTDGSYLKDMAQQSFALQNDFRAQQGVPAFAWSDELYESAKVRAAELVQQFSHTRPDGSSCFTAFTGKWRNMGENIAYGQRTAQQVTQGWYNSEGHRKNMLRSNFTNAAVACYEYRGQIYWVTLFGER